MAAQALSAYTRYTSRGTSKTYWIPGAGGIVNPAAPTRAELNAGWDLTTQLADSSGWTVSADQIDAPDMSNMFTPKVAGAISAEDSTITMYSNVTGVDVRTLMAQGVSGFIVWLDGGDVVGRKMDVWPVTVSSVSKQRSVQGSDVNTIVFTYTPTAQPSVDAPII